MRRFRSSGRTVRQTSGAIRRITRMAVAIMSAQSGLVNGLLLQKTHLKEPTTNPLLTRAALQRAVRTAIGSNHLLFRPLCQVGERKANGVLR
jgi:hypothetical protein